MKKNQILEIMIGFCLILFLQQIPSSSILVEGTLSPKDQNDSPIQAISNDEIAVLSQYGNGTESNPYVIENLCISSPNTWAIALENINVSLIIRYCEFKNSMGGIYMEYCENITILNNSFDDLDQGIQGYFAQRLVIGNNTFNNCKESGIYFYVNNNYHLVQDNQFYSCGIDILGGFGNNNEFENNFANDKQIIVVMSQTGITIENRNDIGEILLINSQNCVISNVSIENSSPAIVVHDSDFIQIMNCSIRSSSSLGLRVYSSDNVDVLNCNFTNNPEIAIKINFCNSANIDHNLFLQNGRGILAVQVWNYLITNNTIIGINGYENGYGIEILSGISENKIINNTIGYCDLECINLDHNTLTEIIDNTLINKENNFIKIEHDTNSIMEGNMNYILAQDLFLTQSQSSDYSEFSLNLEWNSSVFVSEYIILINGVEEVRLSSSINNVTLDLVGSGDHEISLKTISSFYSYEYDDFNNITITLGEKDKPKIVGFPIEIMMIPIVFTIGIIVKNRKNKS